MLCVARLVLQSYALCNVFHAYFGNHLCYEICIWDN